MTIEELLAFMKKELINCNGYHFIDNILHQLRCAMKARQHFSCSKFKKWFIEKNVVLKNSPLNFLSKCGIEDIENGVFDRPTYSSVNVWALEAYMDKMGVSHTNEDMTYVNVYATYIINNELLTESKTSEWFYYAVDYISKHTETKSAVEIKRLVRLSKLITSLNLPYEELDNEAQKLNSETNAILNQINEMEDGNLLKESETI